jgi:lipoprotein-anchoring transpeptidase ErfK/SrfK
MRIAGGNARRRAPRFALGVNNRPLREHRFDLLSRNRRHAEQRHAEQPHHPFRRERLSTQHCNGSGGFIEFLFDGPGDTRMAAPDRRPIYRQAEPSYGAEQTYAPQLREPVEVARPAIDPKYEKQMVAYQGRERAGTIVVDTPNKFLYLVQGDGSALRYGIGVGRPGFTWGGVQNITMKREWPDWRPPSEMLRRRPDLPRFMKGGIENPLGARAMYLGGSIYRIHGSNEPETIGTAVSSGCIRMANEDVIDLYTRAKVGTKVIVQR